MSRFSSDRRVEFSPNGAVVTTACGEVEVTSRSEGAIHRWVAPFNGDGTWSARDTFHADRDEAIGVVLTRFGGLR